METLWSVRREQADPTHFSHGHVGPYLLGRTVRATSLGEVMLALHASFEDVVEIERFAALRDGPLAGPDCTLLADLAHVTGLRHRYVAPIIGAGMDCGAPYVVRPHRLGRTLAEVVARGPIDPDLGGAILHAVADAIAWLAEQGPAPGSCAMGGFDESDVFLGFDGEVQLLGTGTKLARSTDPTGDPVAADLAALRAMADRLHLGTIVEAGSAAEAVLLLRRAHRSSCTERAPRIGVLLRSRFQSDIDRERTTFRLPLLH